MMRGQSSHRSPSQDRVISLGPRTVAIPERLLLAHARGEVLFVAGAGVSLPAGLPDFRSLVLQVYGKLGDQVHAVIDAIPPFAHNRYEADLSGLTDRQAAEVKRFINKDYDVVLGMLERRIDDQAHARGSVRRAVVDELRRRAVRPAPIHRTLIRLADRGVATTIVTTNFELLLEDAGKGLKLGQAIQTYSLGGIPRPSYRDDFAGVLHIHGALDRDPDRTSDLIMTDQDFGEFYLRRRVAPDFIYDAARLYNLVLVGYSANDPPMRYLLNAVDADVTRFGDLKERFAFVSAPDSVEKEDWKGRGITPIAYDSANEHAALLETLQRWAALLANNGNPSLVDRVVKRTVRKARGESDQADRDLFDLLIRRADPTERSRLAGIAGSRKADYGWLEAITAIAKERERERRR
jgi:hypothetical protein